MHIKLLVALAALSLATPAMSQTVVNSAPTFGFQYGTGNDYTPANAIVNFTGPELALRFHQTGIAAPTSDANGVYSFSLGTSPISYDYSMSGLFSDCFCQPTVSLTLTNILTGATFSYNPIFVSDNYYSNGQTQNSGQLGFSFLGLGFNANENNTYSAVLTNNGQSVTAFARIGEGAVAAVPEPSTWGMMLLGFAGIGVAFRRRRPATLRQTA